MGTKILFICKDNAGRSQIAEGYYNQFTDSSDASSAGIDPTIPEKWKKLAPEVLQVMQEERIDLSSKKVKIVTEEMIKVADRIVIMCKKEDCPNFLLKHRWLCQWEIEEPEKASIEKLRLVRDKIRMETFKLLKVYP
jgi:arsenate reductase (thioredoxin)